MLATVHSATLIGVDGRPITVEVHVAPGLPSFAIVGLPDASCREARDRVRAAIVSSDLKWPQHRITVNLAPTSVRKSGSGLDLPIAVALLAADGQLDPRQLEGLGLLGELGLDGTLRRVGGILPLVDAIDGASVVVVPSSCAAEASLVGRHRVRPVRGLRELVAVLRGEGGWAPDRQPTRVVDPDPEPDLADVRGQVLGRLAIEVAAAGGHHLLLVGPPGAGKTMLAQRLPGLLPDLPPEQALEVTRIHSASGLDLPAGALIRRPPFRAPHHSASTVSLIGGGSYRMRPGEISAAHRGVLFLDELGEFAADALDNLRQPLEEGTVLVCRAHATARFPARFLLVAAMNPCPCGGDGGPGACRCSETSRERYQRRVSGPILDRFDLRVAVDRPDILELLPTPHAPPVSAAEPTSVVAARVRAARRLSERRGVAANAEIPAGRLDALAPLTDEARAVLEVRLRQGRLSARGLHRVRRVARTLADLDGRSGLIDAGDVHAALALRTDPLRVQAVAS